MEILRYSLGQLQTNCYFLINGNNCLIIDPGDEANFILEELQRKKLNLVGLLATHGHFDHIGAVGEIQKSVDVPLYIFKEDQFLIDRLNETAEHFLGFNPHFLKPDLVNYLTKSELKIKNFTRPSKSEGRSGKLKIIRTPGHTPGGCSYYFEKDKVLFTGDTLFKQGIGRYDFSYCDKKDLFESIKKIIKLPKDTIIYPGHGDETTITQEL